MNDDTQPQRPVPPSDGTTPTPGAAGSAAPDPTTPTEAPAHPVVGEGRWQRLRGWRGAAVVGAAAVILGSAGGVAIAAAGDGAEDDAGRDGRGGPGGYGATGYGAPDGRPGTAPGDRALGERDGPGGRGGPRGECDGDGPVDPTT